MQKQALATKGFTLVELSIVIIIIGFLIAGIAGGQSLIASAKLHSIITEVQSLQTASRVFTEQYGGLPGD
jgi:prepilin-type N-terminal cleavage/methylation domain-containing protein